MPERCPYRKAAPRLQARARAAALFLPTLPGYERHHWSYRQAHWKDVIIIPAEMHHRLHAFLTYEPEHFCFRGDDGVLLDTREKHRDFMHRVLRLPRHHD